MKSVLLWAALSVKPTSLVQSNEDNVSTQALVHLDRPNTSRTVPPGAGRRSGNHSGRNRLLGSGGGVDNAGKFFVIINRTAGQRWYQIIATFARHYLHWVHILMGVTGNLDLIVDSEDRRFVNKTRQPGLGERGVPRGVSICLRWYRFDVRSVGEQTITSVRQVWVERLLI